MDTTHKIPLRQFYRKIEDLIINKSSEAAILYAKLLLEKFPRNIAVYQLLGKSLLDKKEFDNANLIFNTILRVDPDNLVSYIGISLIAENFGNLNEALDNMIRAFELQPSNESLQNEVKRLYKAMVRNKKVKEAKRLLKRVWQLVKE